jgi:hypothetical protein
LFLVCVLFLVTESLPNPNHIIISCFLAEHWSNQILPKWGTPENQIKIKKLINSQTFKNLILDYYYCSYSSFLIKIHPFWSFLIVFFRFQESYQFSIAQSKRLDFDWWVDLVVKDCFWVFVFLLLKLQNEVRRAWSLEKVLSFIEFRHL